MPEAVDFIKIKNYAVININNMFPVPNGLAHYVDISKERNPKYKSLLLAEYRAIKAIQEKIRKNAKMIYTHKIENGNAVFTFADIKSLAVIEYSASSYSDATSSTKDSAKDKTTGNSTSGSNGTVQTGEALPAVMILATLCALCAFLFMKKRFQKYPEEHHD